MLIRDTTAWRPDLQVTTTPSFAIPDDASCMRRCMLPAYGAGPYIPALVLERPVTVRERHDGLYTAFTYLVYKVCLPSF